MKKYSMILCVPVFVTLCGCSILVKSTYGVAMDERGAGTIVSDKKIKLAIQEKLLQDDAIKVLDISTFCYNGEVYLVGEYETEKEREEALEIAEGTPGVKSVTPYLHEKEKDATCTRPESLRIGAEIRTALIGDKDIQSTNVDQKVVHCYVVLLGIVGSKKEITKAVAHARGVKGVRDVTSYLRVAP